MGVITFHGVNCDWNDIITVRQIRVPFDIYSILFYITVAIIYARFKSIWAIIILCSKATYVLGNDIGVAEIEEICQWNGRQCSAVNKISTSAISTQEGVAVFSMISTTRIYIIKILEWDWYRCLEDYRGRHGLNAHFLFYVCDGGRVGKGQWVFQTRTVIVASTIGCAIAPVDWDRACVKKGARVEIPRA